MQGDFLIDDLLIEVGGKSKKAQQISSSIHYLLAVDDLERACPKNTIMVIWVFVLIVLTIV